MTKEICRETAGSHLLKCSKTIRHRACVNIDFRMQSLYFHTVSCWPCKLKRVAHQVFPVILPIISIVTVYREYGKFLQQPGAALLRSAPLMPCRSPPQFVGLRSCFGLQSIHPAESRSSPRPFEITVSFDLPFFFSPISSIAASENLCISNKILTGSNRSTDSTFYSPSDTVLFNRVVLERLSI